MTVVIDLSQAEMVDSTTLALLPRSGRLMPTVITTNRYYPTDTMGFDAIFVIPE